MIEVKKKFILSEKEIERLTAGADFLGEQTFTDTYYDTEQFALTKNDMWLRKRGTEFELKIPTYQEVNSPAQQYQEIKGEGKIREVFALAPLGSFENDIASFGYAPFCVLTTTRRKFKKEGFSIDLDCITSVSSKGGLTDWEYQIGEIELLVNEKEEMPAAALGIEKFAQENKLKIAPMLGNVIEYLKRKKPAHYQSLLK